MTVTVNGLDGLKALAGTGLGHTGWLEITQERVNAFADATDDHQWIHVDRERAAAGPFGGTIAHGFLTLSLTIPLFGELMDVRGLSMQINYGLNRVRFPAPVPAGSRVRARIRVDSVEPIQGGVQVTMTVTFEREGGEKPVCVAEQVFRFVR